MARKHSNPLIAHGVTYRDIAHAQYDAAVIRDQIGIYGPSDGRSTELHQITSAVRAQLKSLVPKHDPKHLRHSTPEVGATPRHRTINPE